MRLVIKSSEIKSQTTRSDLFLYLKRTREEGGGNGPPNKTIFESNTRFPLKMHLAVEKKIVS